MVVLLFLLDPYFKGIIRPKMKVLSSFTHPQAVPNLYEFRFSAEYYNFDVLRRYFEERW